MSRIPNFDEDGLLPAGDYEVSFDELRESILVEGPDDSQIYPCWDKVWREQLVDNLEIMTRQLWQVGVRNIFADGSFAEDKDHPNDIDGYFECDLEEFASGELQRRLNMLDSSNVWTWDPLSRQPYGNYLKKQLPMWHRYRVELYPHVPGLGVSAIRDKYGIELGFPAAFRQSRRGDKARGIVKIRYGDGV